MSRHLMARFRHLGSPSGWADWRPQPMNQPCPVCPWTHPNLIMHKAKLENGHELHAFTYDDKLWPELQSALGPEELGWSWAIVDPSRHPGEPSKYESHADADSKHTLAGNGGDSGSRDDPWHRDYIPTLEDAKAEAEAHYQKMFPLGSDTGPHDSGVDYSDLNKFMGEL